MVTFRGTCTVQSVMAFHDTVAGFHSVVKGNWLCNRGNHSFCASTVTVNGKLSSSRHRYRTPNTAQYRGYPWTVPPLMMTERDATMKRHITKVDIERCASQGFGIALPTSFNMKCKLAHS